VLEGVPAGVDYKALKDEVETLPGIEEVEALRVWSMDNEHHAAEAVIATSLIAWDDVEVLKESLRQLLAQHGVEQCVIEVKTECTPNACSLID
jgi:Co/Zn/Cd efflux system component